MKAVALQYPLNHLKKDDIVRISNKSHLYNRNKNISNEGYIMKNSYSLYLDYVKFIYSMLGFYDEYVKQTKLRITKEDYINFIIRLVNSQLELGVSISDIENALFFAKLDNNDINYLKSIRELIVNSKCVNYKNISKVLVKESLQEEM